MLLHQELRKQKIKNSYDSGSSLIKLVDVYLVEIPSVY